MSLWLNQRHRSVAVAAALAFATYGCASQPAPLRPLASYRADPLGRVGVVFSAPLDAAKYTGPSGRKESADRAANEITGESVDVLPILPLTAIGGALYGIFRATPEEAAQAAQAALVQAYNDALISQYLGEATGQTAASLYGISLNRLELNAGEDPAEPATLRRLSESGLSSLLAIRVVSVQLDGWVAADPDLTLMVTVQAKRFLLSDGSEVFSRQYNRKTGPRPLSEWVSNSASVLASELNRLATETSTRIVEDSLLLIEFPQEGNPHGSFRAQTGTPPPWMCGLSPSPDLGPPSGFSILKLSANNPILSWEAFPNEHHRRAINANLLPQARDITYELKVWQFLGPPRRIEPLYWRKGLTQNAHRVERQLPQDVSIVWSVRAHMNLNDMARVTSWTVLSYGHEPCADPEDLDRIVLIFKTR